MFSLHAWLAMACTGIPHVSVSGTHYEVGLGIGSALKRSIRSALQDPRSELQRAILPYVQTAVGRHAYQSLLRASVAFYPELLDEIHGIADGASLPFTLVATANLAHELSGLAVPHRSLREDLQCSDMMRAGVVRDSFIAHNEDGSALLSNTTYIVSANVSGHQFTAFTYPGLLSSASFGFNAHGVMFTDNALFPEINLGGVGQMFLHRRMLEASSIDHAIRMHNETNCASGFNLNLASTTEPGRVVGLEVAPGKRLSKIELRNGSAYMHFNEYRRLHHAGAPEPSSEHRLRRAEEMCHCTDGPPTVSVARSILGDTADSEYPIFRRGTPEDPDVTLCTVVFDSAAATMQIFRQNPTAGLPELTLSVPRPAPHT